VDFLQAQASILEYEVAIGLMRWAWAGCVDGWNIWQLELEHWRKHHQQQFWVVLNGLVLEQVNQEVHTNFGKKD
jgi:hypothetical protein